MKNEHVVLGTGPLGLSVIEELLKQGKNVVAVNRSEKDQLPKEVQFISCDISDENKTKELMKNALVVYHCIGLPYKEWESTLPNVMKNIICAAEANDVKIVYADNLYAYGQQTETVLNEEMSYNPVGVKTKTRAELATMLISASKEGRVRATIGRASDFYGPGVRNSILGDRVFQHLLDEKSVELIGNPDKLHSHIYIKDFAKGLIMLGDDAVADGEVWHIPHPEPTSTRNLVEAIASQLSKKPTYRIANKLIVSVMGLFNPTMNEFKELMYQNTNDFIVDSNKFNDQFTFKQTSHEQAIKETCDWYTKLNHN